MTTDASIQPPADMVAQDVANEDKDAGVGAATTGSAVPEIGGTAPVPAPVQSQPLPPPAGMSSSENGQATPANAFQAKVAQLQQAGFKPDEISDYTAKTGGKLLAAGFDQNQVNNYLGIKYPDAAPINTMVQENLAKAQADQDAKTQNAEPGAQPQPPPTFPQQLDTGTGFPASKMLAGVDIGQDALSPKARALLMNCYAKGTASNFADFAQCVVPQAAQAVSPQSEPPQHMLLTGAALAGLRSALNIAPTKEDLKYAANTTAPYDFHPGMPNFSKIIGKTVYGLTSSSPQMGGAIAGGLAGGDIGGPIGAVAGTGGGAALIDAVKNINPIFQAQLKLHPGNPDAAWTAAKKELAVSAAGSGVSMMMFGISPFESAAKNLMFQALGVQPAVGAAQQAARNKIENKPAGEGVLQAAGEAGAGTLVPMLPHVIVHVHPDVASIVAKATGKDPAAVTPDDVHTQVAKSAATAQVPEAQTFNDHAVVLAGHEKEAQAADGLRKTYAETGVTPDKVLEDSSANPEIKKAIEDGKIPEAYEHLRDEQGRPVPPDGVQYTDLDPDSAEFDVHKNIAKEAGVDLRPYPKDTDISEHIPPMESAPAGLDDEPAKKDEPSTDVPVPVGRFHGTSMPIKDTQEYTYNGQNIYGQGLYTTDSYGIAKGYSKKGGGDQPTIYHVGENPGLKLYDLEKPLKDHPEIQASLDELAKHDRILDETLEYMREGNSNPSLRDVYDELRNYDAPADDIQGTMDSITHLLEEQGYHGVQHIGGGPTGSQPHNVRIYFNPKRDIQLTANDGNAGFLEHDEGNVFYHGTPAKFDNFDDNHGGPHWFTADKDAASSYTEGLEGHESPRVIAAKIKAENPKIIDAQGRPYNKLPEEYRVGDKPPPMFDTGVSTNEVAAQAKAEGHDAIVVKNVRDNLLDQNSKPTTIAAVFKNEQIHQLGEEGNLIKHSSEAAPFAEFAKTYPQTPEGMHQAAKDFVINRGNETGNEHMVLTDHSGQAHFLVEGTPREIILPQNVKDALNNPDSAFVWHHNHPAQVGVSPEDTAKTAGPAQVRILAHAVQGGSSEARINPAFGERWNKLFSSRYENPRERGYKQRKALQDLAQYAFDRTRTLLNKYSAEGKYLGEKRGSLHNEIFNKALQEAGIIEHTSDMPFEDPAGVMDATVAEVVKGIQRKLKRDGNEPETEENAGKAGSTATEAGGDLRRDNTPRTDESSDSRASEGRGDRPGIDGRNSEPERNPAAPKRDDLTPDHQALEDKFGVPENMTRAMLSKIDKKLGAVFADTKTVDAMNDEQFQALDDYAHRIEVAREAIDGEHLGMQTPQVDPYTPEEADALRREDPDLFAQYAAARRAVGRYYKGQSPGMPFDEARAVLRDNWRKYEPAFTSQGGRPPTPEQYEFAKNVILKTINKEPEPVTDKKLSWDNLYTKTIDKWHPIAKIVAKINEAGGKVAADKDAYKLFRLNASYADKALHFLEHGTFDFGTFRTNGLSLKEILDPVKHDLDGLRAYATSRRALELEERGIKSGKDITAARAVVAGGDTAFKGTFDNLVDYQDKMLQYLRDSGFLSSEQYTNIKALNKDFIPFHRLMDPGESSSGTGGNPVKTIKGSERHTIDPIESVIKNTYAFMKAASHNAALRSFYEHASTAEKPEDFFTESSASLRPVTVTDDEMKSFLSGNGIEDVPESALTVFRTMKTPLAKDEIGFFNDGKWKVLQVDPDLAEAFSSTDIRQHGLLMSMLKVPAALLRSGLVTPEFIVRHLERNQMSASILAKEGNVPFVDTFKGLVSYFRKDGDYQAALKAGAMPRIEPFLNRDTMQEEMQRLTGEKQKIGAAGQAWNIVKTPLNFLHAVQQTLESSTRLGAFKHALGDQEATKENTTEASFNARNIAPDPARIGSKTAFWNAITPLFNTELQHTDQLTKALATRTLPTLAKIIAGVTLPSLALWSVNHNNPMYQQAAPWEKDFFWLIPMGDHLIRIPKPFLLGEVFGSGPERIMDKLAGNDATNIGIKHFFSDAAEWGTPNFIPAAIAPALEQVTNHSFFRDAPLVPDRLMRLLPEYRYTPYTSEITKTMGDALGHVPYIKSTSLASPIVLDNYIYKWTGGVGVYAERAADAALRATGTLPNPNKPENTLADLPVIKAFVSRYPSAQAESIQEFDERFREKEQVFDTIQTLTKEGNTKEADRVAKEYGDTFDQDEYDQLKKVNRALRAENQTLQKIYANPDIDPHEKRQLMESGYFEMINAAQEANKTMNDRAPAKEGDVEEGGEDQGGGEQ